MAALGDPPDHLVAGYPLAPHHDSLKWFETHEQVIADIQGENRSIDHHTDEGDNTIRRRTYLGS